VRADNSGHIIAAARRRTDDARQKTAAALRRMDASGQPVTFSTVAAAAGVSRSWLYAQDDLRAQIERLRERQRHHRRSPTGSVRHPPRCCAAWKQQLPGSVPWNPRTGNCATRSSARSESSARQ
jgi:Family of unknown function (DUF6262)